MHTVTITKLPDDVSDDYEYTFGGEHGTDCGVWLPCKRKACQAMNPDREPYDERVRHGKDHFHRDGEWLVESNQCALRYVFEYSTAWEAFNGLELGTYPISIEWEDTWWIEVQPSEREEANQDA